MDLKIIKELLFTTECLQCLNKIRMNGFFKTADFLGEEEKPVVNRGRCPYSPWMASGLVY